MTNITDDLAAVLQQIHRPGDFHASGTFDLRPPEIEVEGFGVLALPVLPDQAKRLVAIAERAPFGRGQETIVDTDVRRSWQISTDHVRISGKRWKAALDEVVNVLVSLAVIVIILVVAIAASMLRNRRLVKEGVAAGSAGCPVQEGLGGPDSGTGQACPALKELRETEEKYHK